jgi:hypothetical protein
MNAAIPQYMVHLWTAWKDANSGQGSLRDLESPAAGILFQRNNLNLRYVVGATKKRSKIDGIHISRIAGIDEEVLKTRGCLSHPFSVNLADVFMKGNYELEYQNWALLRTTINCGEQPGHYDANKQLIPATPLPFPDTGLFSSASIPKCDSSEVCVFGVRSNGAITETVPVMATLVKMFKQGIVVELPEHLLSQVEFSGAPICSTTRELFAMGLFCGQLNSNKLGLVGIRLQNLFSMAGHMIESTL